jgi:hypothetical protein
VVSEPVKPASAAGIRAKPDKAAGDHGAGVFVALATVAVVALIAAWLVVPGFQSVVERSVASRSASVRAVAAPVSKPRTATRPVRRAPVAPVSPSPEKRRGSSKLRTVQDALLKVDSDPRAVLYVDGVRVGLTPVSRHRLALGTHRLRVELKGYQTVSETIVVKSTGPVSRRYKLRRRQGR